MKRMLLRLFVGIAAVFVLVGGGFALLLTFPVPDPLAQKKSGHRVGLSNVFIVDLDEESVII